MKIRDFEIPELLVECISTGKLNRDKGSWLLKREMDAYGNELETELGHLCKTKNEIIKASEALKENFVSDGEYGDHEVLSMPGALPDIVDFSSVICFGESSDGAPFCLDYREDIESPGVIWWDDIYWRSIAPSFKEFFQLLDTNS